jgi:adenine-specific DNA-methyltransferase
LALNAEDGGNRRFILVEQEDYADTLTAERIRRVIQGAPHAKDKALQEGLGGSFTFCTLGPNFDDETLLKGGLPSYQEMGRFVFFTATGEKLDESQINEPRCYLGESSRYSVYLIYQPDIEYLKKTPLNLDFAMHLPPASGKQRLVIASHKYLDEDRMAEYRIEFCQLPWGIYRYRAA